MDEWEFARRVHDAISVDWKRVEETIDDAGLADDYDGVVEIANEIEHEIQDGVESGAVAVFAVEQNP